MELAKNIQTVIDPNVLFVAVCPFCKQPTRVSRLMNIECCGKKYPVPKGIPTPLFKQYVMNVPGAEDEYNDRMEYLTHPRI